MVSDVVWEKLSAIARQHVTYRVFSPWKRVDISLATDVAADLGLQGELAVDFFEDIVTAFPEFELSTGRGDFNIQNYFLSEISQSAFRSLLYPFYPKVKRADRAAKSPLTLGMLEDAISRGYWDSARY
jgi:hypothetical protein